ncbi:hypothetical protein [uncultured Dysosmobacter sp.]|uniref:hypothetical protein n=1 Tax=uncultured Dysosmobacter sp. TaxID=2591384 RepID=UPI00261B1929|nr:hypothetical protein [uncultured Dysosmobacter sp.]
MTCGAGVSPTYPYERTIEAPRLRGVENVPRKLVQYLMDLPLPGYVPPDDNAYPRCRLMKYLFWDTADPLRELAPTTEEKLSILFDPKNAARPPTKRGYRLYPQSYVAQSQTDAQTRLLVYMGRTTPVNTHNIALAVHFDILTSVSSEQTAGAAMSRVFAMEQCVIEALNGVNIDGMGTVYFNRQAHGDCGSLAVGDRGTNIGRALVMGLSWME